MGTPDAESAELIARWRSGDQKAAEALFWRYAQRLIALARSRLSEKLARRVDPEDVVQSAYRSFFIGAREGRFVVQHSGDLWRLLVSLVLHKLHRQVERHTARKRALDRERCFEEGHGLRGLPVEPLTRDPSPAEAAALADELEQVMRVLDPFQRQVLERRLQDYTLDEIANELKCSQRTVRRVMQQVRKHLATYDREHASP